MASTPQENDTSEQQFVSCCESRFLETPTPPCPVPPSSLFLSRSIPAFRVFFLFFPIHLHFRFFSNHLFSISLTRTKTMTRITLGLVSLLALSSAVSMVSAHEGHDHAQNEFHMPGDSEYTSVKDELAEFQVQCLFSLYRSVAIVFLEHLAGWILFVLLFKSLLFFHAVFIALCFVDLFLLFPILTGPHLLCLENRLLPSRPPSWNNSPKTGQIAGRPARPPRRPRPKERSSATLASGTLRSPLCILD